LTPGISGAILMLGTPQTGRAGIEQWQQKTRRNGGHFAV